MGREVSPIFAIFQIQALNLSIQYVICMNSEDNYFVHSNKQGDPNVV